MTFTSEKDLLKYEGVKIHKFDYPIKDILSFDEIVVVLIDDEQIERGNSERNRNVYCVDKNGALLWQVEKREHIYDDSPYIMISKAKGKLGLHNWDGTVYVTNPTTGEMSERYWLK